MIAQAVGHPAGLPLTSSTAYFLTGSTALINQMEIKAKYISSQIPELFTRFWAGVCRNCQGQVGERQELKKPACCSNNGSARGFAVTAAFLSRFPNCLPEPSRSGWRAWGAQRTNRSDSHRAYKGLKIAMLMPSFKAGGCLNTALPQLGCQEQEDARTVWLLDVQTSPCAPYHEPISTPTAGDKAAPTWSSDISELVTGELYNRFHSCRIRPCVRGVGDWHGKDETSPGRLLPLPVNGPSPSR